MSGGSACDQCLARTWLLARLSGHLDNSRARLFDALALCDDELLAALGGRQRAAITAELAGVDPLDARARCQALGVEQVCRCDVAYPTRLRELPDAPAVLHLAGGAARFLELVSGQPVAVIGARRASTYGIECAGGLARGLAAAGIIVISGLALGIDSAAHHAVLELGGRTVAVLPGGVNQPYPPAKRGLARRVALTGALVSELPPGTPVRRWMFPARNRIIAALAAMTVVVEATERSGALITASLARGLGRRLGAVPGRINSRLAAGPNRLITSGATLIRGPEDVFDELFGVGAGPRPGRAARPRLTPEREAVLEAIRDGADTPAALARSGFATSEVLAAVGELELAGYVSRGHGGQLTPIV